ncbi:quinone oxidoreductase family protein [Adhaeribacter radiodurans]|uniref:NADP-dependent oxidoreductase n=1 Tax=Adhaeribacter radiodurans TaxID=2745197 RepID=A0A7L7L964_9BACT|nr:NADP-dependent oxidoreductase [Adhaeribacter radiodurans]QMU29376.1 NADP-dependent oxidoreductase [Adhaeribacter radiodurans]
MKAVVLKSFGSIDNFALTEVENPNVAANEVLVKIKATAFNPIDYQMRQGSSESKLLKSFILGRELSGVILEVGHNVTGFATGDEITAYVGSLASNGTYAELISIPQQLIAKKPSVLSHAQAAALPLVGLTALQCFERLTLPLEATIFMSGGAGGVGTILIQLLLTRGYQKLITTAGNTESQNHLLSLGLPSKHIIDYHENDYLAKIKDQVPRGTYDGCIDLVGGYMAEVCAELIKIHGVYVDVTFLTTIKAREVLFNKATTILNVANYAYTLSGNIADTSLYGKNLTTLFQKVESRIILPAEVEIIGNLNVETVQLAHQKLETNQTKGKKLVMLIE